MFLVTTRNFPPELGGMQNLMEGLSNALLNHGPVKVFADSIDNAEDYDQNSKLTILAFLYFLKILNPETLSILFQ